MRIFVTGATGWIGSAVVPELIGAGHEVVGLARSEASAAALATAGAEAHRGSLDDLEGLRSVATSSDAVVHLAFKHEEAFSGNFEAAAEADRHAIEVFGAALEGSGRPLVIASGLASLATGTLATETDMPDPDLPAGDRTRSEQMVLSLASSGVRSSSLRLSPSVHGEGDHGFVATLVGIARDRGVSGYIAEGTNHWPAVHRLDAARLFRLALETAPAGSVLHGVADEGVPTREIAEVIGRHLEVPVSSISREDAGAHFGWLAAFFGADIQASSARTRELMGWEPTQPGLIDDLDEGHYFHGPSA